MQGGFNTSAIKLHIDNTTVAPRPTPRMVVLPCPNATTHEAADIHTTTVNGRTDARPEDTTTEDGQARAWCLWVGVTATTTSTVSTRVNGGTTATHRRHHDGSISTVSMDTGRRLTFWKPLATTSSPTTKRLFARRFMTLVSPFNNHRFPTSTNETNHSRTNTLDDGYLTEDKRVRSDRIMPPSTRRSKHSNTNSPVGSHKLRKSARKQNSLVLTNDA